MSEPVATDTAAIFNAVAPSPSGTMARLHSVRVRDTGTVIVEDREYEFSFSWTNVITERSTTEDALRWQVFDLIRANEGIRISGISDALGIDLPHAVEIVEGLRAKGVIGPA